MRILKVNFQLQSLFALAQTNDLKVSDEFKVFNSRSVLIYDFNIQKVFMLEGSQVANYHSIFKANFNVSRTGNAVVTNPHLERLVALLDFFVKFDFFLLLLFILLALLFFTASFNSNNPKSNKVLFLKGLLLSSETRVIISAHKLQRIIFDLVAVEGCHFNEVRSKDRVKV